MMNHPLLYILLLTGLLLTACFEEDSQLEPYVSEYTVIQLDESIYTHQSYVDLGAGEVLSVNANNAWELAFESGDSGTCIRVNASDLWEIAATGETDPDLVDPGGSFRWRSDRPGGDPDSTATRNWVTRGPEGNIYSGEIYLLGQFDGIGYSGIMKLQFLHVDSAVYRFVLYATENQGADTITVTKETGVNYVQFSLREHAGRTLEPPRDEWELLFSQYQAILFTDDGIPTPYYVRGALLNPNRVSASLDSLHSFDEIDYQLASGLSYSRKLDFIGHDWKAVTIDEGTNSAVYAVREGYTYVIRDMNNEIYKIRFTSYLGSTGVRGYPSFEISRLEPGF